MRHALAVIAASLLAGCTPDGHLDTMRFGFNTGTATPYDDAQARLLTARLVADGYSDADIARFGQILRDGFRYAQVESIVAAGEQGRALGHAAAEWLNEHPGEPLPPYLMPPTPNVPMNCVSTYIGAGTTTLDCY